MTFLTTTPDSVDLLDALKGILDAEQALAEAEVAEAAALAKLAHAKQQREMHPGSKWDWDIGVEDAEAALAEARKRVAEARRQVRRLLEALDQQAGSVPEADRKRKHAANAIGKQAGGLAGKVAPDGDGRPLDRGDRVKGYLALLNAIIMLEDHEHDAVKETLKRAAQALGTQQAALDKARQEWQARADQDANNIDDPAKKARAKELAAKASLTADEEAEMHKLITENVGARHLDNYNKARRKVTDARAELERLAAAHKDAVEAARAYLTRVEELSERIARWLAELGDDPQLQTIASRLERKRELIARLLKDVEAHDTALERFLPRAEPSSWALPGAAEEQFIGKPARDRLLVGTLLSAVAVLLLSGAAFVYSVTGGNASGGTASGASGSPTNTAVHRQLADGDQRLLSIRLMTDGDPLSDDVQLTRAMQGEARQPEARDLQGESSADQDEIILTPAPQPTPEALDDFAVEPSPTATPQPPAPASDDFASEPEPTTTPVPPSASDELAAEPEPTPTPPAVSDELAAEPEPTETPEPPATTNDIVAQPEPSPTPTSPPPGDELSAEPTATPAPVVSDTLTLATPAPEDDASDTTIVAPVGP